MDTYHVLLFTTNRFQGLAQYLEDTTESFPPEKWQLVSVVNLRADFEKEEFVYQIVFAHK